MATGSDIKTIMASAAAAVASGDYGSAVLLALQAQALMASLPDTTADGDQIQWKPEQIAGFISTCERQRTAAAGIRTTKIVRRVVGECY